MNISEIINHLGEDRSSYLNSAVPPLIQASMFSFDSTEDMRNALKNESEIPFYTRGTNPTVKILQEKIAALENAENSLVLASGSAAVASAVMANVQTGSHVIAVKKPYAWTNALINNLLPRFGVETSQIDGIKIENFEKSIKSNTKLIFLESPNSWTFEQQNLEEVAQLAKKHNIITIIDNSYASPLLQKPLDFGIDIVVHSATKYINGHSDALAGVICSSKAMIKHIFSSEFMTLGGTISPFNAWLLLRGLRTLPIRLEKVSQTTPKVVEFLENHPKIEKVYYPFSKDYPQKELSHKQMTKPNGMFSIQIKSEKMEQVEAFCDHLKLFLLACSWGSYESLAFPACTLYHSENYNKISLPWNMVRLSLGLEDAEILIEDLKQALEKV